MKYDKFFSTVAAIIAIFAFLTGITALPQLFTDSSQKEDKIPEISSSKLPDESIANEDKSNNTNEIEAMNYSDCDLSELEPIEGEIYMGSEVVEDVYGNSYDSYFDIVLTNAIDLDEESVEYALNKEYSTFSGILFTDKRAEADSAYRMMVYADDTLVYKSPLIKKKTKPTKFEVSVSEVEFLKIVFRCNCVSNAYAGLYDAKLSV